MSCTSVALSKGFTLCPLTVLKLRGEKLEVQLLAGRRHCSPTKFGVLQADLLLELLTGFLVSQLGKTKAMYVLQWHAITFGRMVMGFGPIFLVLCLSFSLF